MWPPSRVVGRDRALEVDRGRRARAPPRRVLSRVSLHDVGGPGVAVALRRDGQAAAVDRDRVAEPGVARGRWSRGWSAGWRRPGPRRRDGAELLDDAGEHQWSPSSGFMVRRTFGCSPSGRRRATVTSVTAGRNASAIVVIPRSATALRARRRAASARRRRRPRRPARPAGTPPPASGRPRGRRAGGRARTARSSASRGSRVRRRTRLGAVVEDPPAAGQVAQAHHGAQRLVRPAARRTRRGRSARGSSTSTVLVPTSITSHCARSRWVSTRAARRGDPAAGAVGGGAAAVEGGGELPGHERPAVLHREGPRPVDAPAPRRSISPRSTSTPAARRVAAPPAATGFGSGWANTTRRTPASTSARAHGPGAAGVVARLERDHGGRAPGVARRPRASASASACGVPAPRW